MSLHTCTCPWCTFDSRPSWVGIIDVSEFEWRYKRELIWPSWPSWVGIANESKFEWRPKMEFILTSWPSWVGIANESALSKIRNFFCISLSWPSCDGIVFPSLGLEEILSRVGGRVAGSVDGGGAQAYSLVFAGNTGLRPGRFTNPKKELILARRPYCEGIDPENSQNSRANISSSSTNLPNSVGSWPVSSFYLHCVGDLSQGAVQKLLKLAVTVYLYVCVVPCACQD